MAQRAILILPVLSGRYCGTIPIKIATSRRYTNKEVEACLKGNGYETVFLTKSDLEDE